MEADLVQYVRRAENAEAEIQKLVKELEVAEKENAKRDTNSAVSEKLNKLSSNKHEQGKIPIKRTTILLEVQG